MVAPIVSGITSVNHGGWGNTIPAGVNQAALYVGADQIRNDKTSLSGGTAQLSSTIDITDSVVFIQTSPINNLGRPNLSDLPGGLYFALLNDTSNYKQWLVDAANADGELEEKIYYAVTDDANNTGVSEVGTFDPTNVSRIGIWWEQKNTSLVIWETTTSGGNNVKIIEFITVTEGEAANPAVFNLVRSFVDSNQFDQTRRDALINQDPYTEGEVSALPIQIGDGSSALYFEDFTPAKLRAYPLANDDRVAGTTSFNYVRTQIGPEFLRLRFNLAPTNYVNWLFATFSGYKVLVIGSELATCNLFFWAIENSPEVSFNGAVNFVGQIIKSGTISLNGATVDGIISNSTSTSAAVIFAVGDSFSGSIQNCAIACQINCSPGDDLSEIRANFLSNTIDVLLNPSAAGATPIDLTNISGTHIDVRNNTANAITIQIAAGVTVDTTNNTGGAITVSSPTVDYIAPNIADGARVYLAHSQVFTISAADITTANNTITLGNDSNSDAPSFASSSPYTLVSLSQTSGATLPTTSPQIVDGGRYYATISGSDITLFTKESDISGSPITISVAGTDSSGSIFTLTAETQLYNAVVSGGSGVSIPLSLSDGAEIVRKVIYWDNSGTTTATPLYIATFAWSTSGGVTDPQSVNAAIETDAVHESIIAATAINFPGPIKNASGTAVTSLTPTNDGSLLDTSNSGPFAIILEGGEGQLQVNAADADGLALWQDFYAWGVFVSSTEAGIRLVNADTFTAVDIFNFVTDNLTFDNTSSTELNLVGGVGRSLDGSTLKADTQTGSGGINFNALSQGVGATLETGTSGLTAGESATLAKLAARVGIGTAATISATSISTGDNSLNQTITDNGNGSVTVSEN